jgi:hypothetical protein
MPVKTPILKKSHILAMAAVILLAGIVAASPALYQRIAADSQDNTSLVSVLVPEEDSTADVTYAYTFPVVYSNPVYYFPVILRGYDAYVQDGSPVYLPNFNHPEAGCNWTGVAGQIFGTDGRPLNGFTVVIMGTINGSPVSFNSVSGGAQGYGPGGYEIQLSTAPFASTGSLTVYLFNLSLKQVAAPLSLVTLQDCQANLIILNFISKD